MSNTAELQVFHSTTEEELGCIDPKLVEIVHMWRDRQYGYLDARVMTDGVVIALGELMFTRAIYVDCSMTGYSRRYCFKERSLADHWFYRLVNEDHEPEGYIARR